MHQLAGHFQIRFAFQGKVAQTVVKEALDRVHRDGFHPDEIVGVGLRLLELFELLLREAKLFHQLLKGHRLSVGPRLDPVGGHEIPVDPVVIGRPWRFSIADVEHLPILVFVAFVGRDHIGPRETRQVVRTLAQFVREEAGLVASLLGGADSLLVRQHPLRHAADNEEENNDDDRREERPVGEFTTGFHNSFHLDHWSSRKGSEPGIRGVSGARSPGIGMARDGFNACLGRD